MLSHIWSNPWLLKYKSDHKKRVDTKTRRTTSWVLKNTQQQLRGQTEESRPYQQCRLNMLLLLVWFELWTQYPGPLCLWQCLVLLRTYEPIFSQFGATLSNMCIRNAMASLKQTINQLIPALLTLLVVVPRQAFYPKSDLNSRYFPADQISASQHRLCLTGGHLEKMKVRKAW